MCGSIRDGADHTWKEGLAVCAVNTLAMDTTIDTTKPGILNGRTTNSRLIFIRIKNNISSLIILLTADMHASFASYRFPGCTKCVYSKDGPTCCGKGGSWQGMCGRAIDGFQHTWKEGVRICTSVTRVAHRNHGHTTPSKTDGSNIKRYFVHHKVNSP